MAFLVPNHTKAGTGFPGKVRRPPSICSVRMCVTSPGRCPVNKIIFKIELRISPASSNGVQNFGISLSDSTRSRLDLHSQAILLEVPDEIRTPGARLQSAYEKIV